MRARGVANTYKEMLTVTILEAPPSPPATPGRAKKPSKKALVIGALLFFAGVGVGAAGGGSSDGGKVKDLEAQVVTLNGKIDGAKSEGEAVKAEYTAKLAGLDGRDAELDKRQADLDGVAAGLDSREAAVTSKEAAKKKSTFSDGTYEVGIDIVPGTYHTDGAGDLCYFHTSVNGDDIADQVVGNGPQTVVVPAGVRFVKSSSCGTWTKR